MRRADSRDRDLVAVVEFCREIHGERVGALEQSAGEPYSLIGSCACSHTVETRPCHLACDVDDELRRSTSCRTGLVRGRGCGGRVQHLRRARSRMPNGKGRYRDHDPGDDDALHASSITRRSLTGKVAARR